VEEKAGADDAGAKALEEEATGWVGDAGSREADANAQFNLGRMYENGDGVPRIRIKESGGGRSDAWKKKHYKEAVKYYRMAANQGHAEAQLSLGRIYSSGDGVSQDGKEAVKWYHKAADQGIARAKYELGIMYEFGEGVPEDDTKASWWYSEAAEEYRKAAEQGDADAQDSLGSLYANGDGVPHDYKEAVKWFRLAADQGDDDGQYNLGQMYYQGKGVPQDYVQAYVWYSLADAKLAKNNTAKEMTPDQIARAQELSKELYKKINAAK
jgi:TPR repeat protein